MATSIAMVTTTSEDVFLCQNFFAVREEDSRLDAGRGLLLKGAPEAFLDPVTAEQSGIYAHGEQRACAVADFDHDGRVDLALTQNGAATKLYRNTSGTAGLRVRLDGPPNNPTALGAAIRLRFGNRWGPVREIRCGSGCWSQDAATQIFGLPSAPAEVVVRWPGGRITRTNMPADLSEISIDTNGAANR